MESLIHHYLRILDIDPLGYFIRLINISHDESVDLSNIYIRQFGITKQDLTLTSYTFKDQIRPLLRSREIATIYSKDYNQLKFDIEPYIFIAQDTSRWLIDEHIQTEISINKIPINSYRFYSFSSNDIPPLFINRTINSKQISIKSISSSNRYARFIFPYCLSNNNIVNPYTWANERKPMKYFDSYHRRLTTAPTRLQSPKKDCDVL
jgi:hypothetical protein